MKKEISPKSLKSLERLEANYKLIYTVAMSAPLIVAMQNIFLNTNGRTGIWDFSGASGINITSIAIFVIFLVTYTRFFLGDLRYLDLKYLESQQKDEYLRRYSPATRFIDFISLGIHTVFFFILGAAVTDFFLFITIFAIILTINAVWFIVMYFIFETGDKNRPEVRSNLIWSANNIICVLLILIIVNIQTGIQLQYILLIIVALLNSILDFGLTWQMYFPKIEEIIEDK